MKEITLVKKDAFGASLIRKIITENTGYETLFKCYVIYRDVTDTVVYSDYWLDRDIFDKKEKVLKEVNDIVEQSRILDRNGCRSKEAKISALMSMDICALLEEDDFDDM